MKQSSSDYFILTAIYHSYMIGQYSEINSAEWIAGKSYILGNRVGIEI